MNNEINIGIVQKVRNFFKFSTLLLCLILLASACQKEDDTVNEPTQEKQYFEFKVYEFKSDSIINAKSKLKGIITNKFLTKETNLSKNVESSEYGFSIDTSQVLLLESDAYQSYTFVAHRAQETSDILENYVITFFNDSLYTQKLLTYPKDLNTNQWDIANASVTTINDASLLYKNSCATNEAIVAAWDPDAGNCVPWPCASHVHWGSNEANDCEHTGSDAPFDQCSGGWVDSCVGCGGSSGNGSTGSPVGGGGIYITPVIPYNPIPVVPINTQLKQKLGIGVLIGGVDFDAEAITAWIDTPTNAFEVWALNNYLDDNTIDNEFVVAAIFANIGGLDFNIILELIEKAETGIITLIEGELTLATLSQEVPWTSNVGTYNGVSSLAYYERRTIVSNGRVHYQYKLTNNDDILSYSSYPPVAGSSEVVPVLFYYNQATQLWYDFQEPSSYSPLTLDFLWDGFWSATATPVRLATPLEDIIILIEGKDFEGV